MIVCAAFPALSDLAWVYSPTEPLTASQVQVQEARLRRHLRDLGELLALRRPAISTPGSAAAPPSPLRLLGNLMQALYKALSAPLHAALALLLQAAPPEEAARLDRK